MNLTAALRGRTSAMSWQQFFWNHPEWWVKVLYACAWVLMLVHGIQHAGHELHHVGAIIQELGGWLVMVAAMTLPFLMYPIRFAAFSSLWSRRHRAMFAFLLGYLAVWLVPGIVVAWVRSNVWSHTYLLPAACFAIAALWQSTRMYRRYMMACHASHPLTLTGFGADRSCIAYGWKIGIASVQSCWPIMLACAFAGHGLVALVGGTVVEYLIQTASPFKRPLTPTLILAALVLFYAALAFLQSHHH